LPTWAQDPALKSTRPGTSQHRRSQVASLLAEGLTAKEISRRLSLPYSSTTELLREIKEEERLRSSQAEASM
jgi:DNA-binding NarL/FixJ family response regulator